MGLEVGVLLFLIFAITGLLALKVPKPAPPKPLGPAELVCPRCKTKITRTCPNCQSPIPKPAMECPKCHITAKSIPCTVCKTEIHSVA